MMEWRRDGYSWWLDQRKVLSKDQFVLVRGITNLVLGPRLKFGLIKNQKYLNSEAKFTVTQTGVLKNKLIIQNKRPII